MTLILAIANHEHHIQFSDRRLTAPGGTIVDAEANKATVFVCGNGRFSVGFTGLARCPGFVLQRWLVEALGRCAPPDYGVMETARRLRDELTTLFRENRGIRSATRASQCLTIMMSGYIYRAEGTFVGNIWITNFQNFDGRPSYGEAQDAFWIAAERENENSPQSLSFIQRIGAWPAMTRDDEAILRRLLEQAAPLETLLDVGVGLMRRMADRPAAGGTVGQDIAISIVPSDPHQPPTTRVRNASGTDRVTLLDMVRALPPTLGGTVQISDIRWEVSEPVPGMPAFQPKQGRNERCSCGSGLKFKRCCYLRAQPA